MNICLLTRYFDFKGTGVTRIATEVANRLEARGHNIHRISTTGKNLYSYFLYTAATIPLVLPRKNIDAYHALATMEAMWLPKDRSVATFLDLFTTTNPERAGAGMGYDKWKLAIGRKYFDIGSKIATHCRHLVCISEKTKQDVIDYLNVPESRLNVIRLGISEHLEPAPKRDNVFRIGTLGQLDKRKRIDLLVRQFKASHIDAELVVAGQGMDRPMLEGLADGDKRIKFLGLVPENGLSDFYNSLDLFCLSAKTKILTVGGFKEIQSIKIGDLVLTHTGEYKPVKRIYKRPYQSKMIGIRCAYLPGTVYLTPEHPIMVRKDGWSHNANEYEYKRAGEINTNDMVAIPKPCPTSRYMSFNITNRQRYAKATKKLPYHIKYTPNLFRLIGCYLSEGSVSKDGLVFSLSALSSDDELEESIRASILEISPEINVRTYVHSRNRRAVCVYNRTLGAIFGWQFGKSASKKRIPFKILNLADQDGKLLPMLLRTLWIGDGSYKGNKFQYSTVSYHLAYQLLTLLLRFGIMPTMQYSKSHKWSFQLAGESAKKFKELVGLELNYKPRNLLRQWKKGSRCFWVPIRRITQKDNSGKDVYNLDVEDNHTYVSNFVVHNCFPTYIEGYGLPLAEAMACKKPTMVMSDAIIPSELMKRCIVVGDLTSIFDNWSMLSWLMKKVDYEGNYQFAKEHSWDKCLDQYEELYKEITD